MEPKFKTSFIPKKPISVSANPGMVKTSNGFSFFTLLSVVLFLATMIFGGGVFVYEKRLQSVINTQISSLQTVRQQFDVEFISQATRLSNRILAANQILDNHIAPSEIFRLFEESTLKTVAFSSFSFKDGVEGNIEVTANGEGQSFRSIVLQSDEFGATGVLKDVLFTDLQPKEENDRVGFSFKAILSDPGYILYRKNVVEVVDELPAKQNAPSNDGLGAFGNN